MLMVVAVFLHVSPLENYPISLFSFSFLITLFLLEKKIEYVALAVVRGSK